MKIILSLWLLTIIYLQIHTITARRKRGYLLQRSKPNIIFVLADDLDTVLGSTKVMKKTKRILQDEGVTFSNTFTTSPLCCPSRSSILTGRYAHNHDVNTNNKNCSGPTWINGPEKVSVGKLMQEAGYSTAYFGKYLNNYDGTRIPPGWNEWTGLIRNSKYYQYTLNVNGKLVTHKKNYEKDYFTNVMSRLSISHFKRHVRTSPKPLFMMVSMSAPHGPEDAAPQYQHMFEGVKAPRFPNYNYTSKDKHWIIRNTPPLNNVTSQFTDMLYRKRLQTLLSVDDCIEKLYLMLRKTRQLDNTYLIFSSDHGYHLGQFNQVKGKAQPYECDVRIPFYMRGPKLPRGVEVPQIALNIDFVPTFLDIARGHIPRGIDGQSVMDIAVGQVINLKKRKMYRPIWRDTFLIERGKWQKLPTKKIAKTDVKEPVSRLLFHSTRKINRICSKKGYPKPPCSPEKKFICRSSQNGTWYLEKCTTDEESQDHCTCSVVIKKPVDQTNVLLLELKKQFEKLYMRIKRHGIKAIHRLSKKQQTSAVLEAALQTMNLTARQQRNTTNVQSSLDETDKTDKRISDSIERIEYFRNERLKLTRNQVLKNELTKTLKQKANTMYFNETMTSSMTSSTCKCSNNKTLSNENINKNTKKNQKQKKSTGRHMNCFSFNRHHWKHAPFWTGPSFTACTNTPNSSYWCLRTLNTTHNFLYCEFVTGFIEYFDMNRDPYQLLNIAHTIPTNVQKQLHHSVQYLKGCLGSKRCFIRAGENLTERRDTLRKIRRYERRKRHGILVRGSLDDML